MSFSLQLAIGMLVDLFQPMHKYTAIKQKVKELEEELMQAGVWKEQEPAWVYHYQEGNDGVTENFYEWLQFVYLPNLLSENKVHSYTPKQVYLAPQAVHFLGKEAEKTKLLQLLIELDALTD